MAAASLWRNLLLLGFDLHSQRDVRSANFGKTMFSKGKNKKASEAVLYLLFHKLDPRLATVEFKFCYPVVDVAMEVDFRKKAVGLLKEHKTEFPEMKLPEGNQLDFILQNPCGKKFIWFMLYFSVFVLKAQTDRLCSPDSLSHGIHPVLRPEEGSSPGRVARRSKLLETHNMRLARRFVERTKEIVAAQSAWKEFKKKIERRLRSCEDEIREVSDKNTDAKQARSAPFDDLREKIARVRSARQRVESLFGQTGEDRKILESVDTFEPANFVMEDLDYRTPDLIKDVCEEQFREGKLLDPRGGGALSLLGLIQVFNIALEKIVASQADTYKGFSVIVKAQQQRGAGLLRHFVTKDS